MIILFSEEVLVSMRIAQELGLGKIMQVIRENDSYNQNSDREE